MCHLTRCRACGKETWAGCGRHAALIQSRVHPSDWCPCDKRRSPHWRLIVAPGDCTAMWVQQAPSASSRRYLRRPYSNSCDLLQSPGRTIHPSSGQHRQVSPSIRCVSHNSNRSNETGPYDGSGLASSPQTSPTSPLRQGRVAERAVGAPTVARSGTSGNSGSSGRPHGERLPGAASPPTLSSRRAIAVTSPYHDATTASAGVVAAPAPSKPSRALAGSRQLQHPPAMHLHKHDVERKRRASADKPHTGAPSLSFIRNWFSQRS